MAWYYKRGVGRIAAYSQANSISGNTERIPVRILLHLHKIGFKLVPLSRDGKAPNVAKLLTREEVQRSMHESVDGKEHPVNYIYNHPEFWSVERIEKESWRFDNVATTFGKTDIKDSQGGDLYLNELDIDSNEVFTTLAVIPVNDKDYFFIDEVRKITYVVKTKKEFGLRIFWLSHKQNNAIGIKDCRVSCEFEIKTDNSTGHSTLPPSAHRDDPAFHYKNIGQNTIAIRDELYDGLVRVLEECLKAKGQKASGRVHNENHSENEIDLTDSDIENIVLEVTKTKIYQKNDRNNIVYGLSGYLCKSNVRLGSGEKIIKRICESAHDEEQRSRIAVLHNTYNRRTKGLEIVGYSYLLQILSRTMGEDSAVKLLDNISWPWRKHKAQLLEQLDDAVGQELSRHTYEVICYNPLTLVIANSDKKQILYAKLSSRTKEKTDINQAKRYVRL
jgi:hypothetical protein